MSRGKSSASRAGRDRRVCVSGRRVLIRRLTSRDCDAFLTMVRRSRPLHRPWAFPPATRASFNEALSRGSARTHARLLVIDRSDGEIVGAVNINEIVRGSFQSAYLGYFGSLPRRNGLMSEGLALVIRYAFTRLKLHRLEANIQPANAASIALAKRCGFRREGVSPRYLNIGGRWRDHERWAITVEDWRRSRK